MARQTGGIANDVRRAGFAGALLVATFLACYLSPLPTEARVRLGALIFLLPVVAAGVSSDRARRRSHGAEGPMWLLMELSASAFLAGWIYRGYVVFTTGDYPPTGSFEDIAILAGYALLLPSAILISGGARLSRIQWLRAILDMAAAFLIAGALAYWLFFLPLVSQEPSAPLFAEVALAAYPILSLGLVAFVAGFGRATRTPWGRLMLAGYLAGMIATTAIIVALGSEGGYHAGSLTTGLADALVMATFLLFALAGVARVSPAYASAPTPPPLGETPAWTGVVVSLLALATVPALIWLAISAPTPQAAMGFAIAATALAAVLVARNVTVIVENARLVEGSHAAERYQAVIESSPVAILVLDLAGRILFANAAAVRVLEAPSAHDLIGMERARFADPDEIASETGVDTGSAARDAAGRMPFSLLTPTPAGQTVTASILTLTGRRLWVERTLREISYEGSPAVLSQLIDITDRVEAERRSAEYQSRLGALAADLLAHEEAEQRRFAEALHDDIGQPLALARMHLSSEINKTGGGTHAQESLRFLDMAIARTRSLTAQISPPFLDDLGLRQALEWLAEQFETQYGLSVRVLGDLDDSRLDEQARSALFRTARELLHNVVKHAAVDQATLEMSQDEEFVQISVVDEGRGLPDEPPDAAGQKGFGLLSIRERLPRLGGGFEIEPCPGGGVRASAWLPVDSAAGTSSTPTAVPQRTD